MTARQAASTSPAVDAGAHRVDAGLLGRGTTSSIRCWVAVGSPTVMVRVMSEQ